MWQDAGGVGCELASLDEDSPEDTQENAVVEHQPRSAEAEGDAQGEGDQTDADVVREQEARKRGQIVGGVPRCGGFILILSRLNGRHLRRQQKGAGGLLVVPRCQVAEDGAGREQERGQQEMQQIATKDGGVAPEEVADQAAEIDARLAVDGEVGAGNQIVQIAFGGFAADEGLCLVQVGGGAAIEPAELDGLLVVERRQTAALNALKNLFQAFPVRTASLKERRKIHIASPRKRKHFTTENTENTEKYQKKWESY